MNKPVASLEEKFDRQYILGFRSGYRAGMNFDEKLLAKVNRRISDSKEKLPPLPEEQG
jgi:hypothetical protein